MSFINLMMLGGLVFTAMPIIILLLINRKKIVLHWAAYEWMKKAKIKKSKRNKLNELLKLIAKTLLMLLLVLFVARPAILSKGGGNRLLVIDKTLSMGTILDERSRLDKAKELAKKLMDEGGMGTYTSIYTFDGTLEALSKRQMTGSSMQSLLNSIELSPKSASFKDFVSAATALPEFKEFDSVYFISDFQKPQYQDVNATVEDARRFGDKKLVFIPADTRHNLLNVAVESFIPPAEGFMPGKENRVTVKVANHSVIPAESIPVTLSVNGVKRDRGIVSLPPNSSAEVSLSVSIPEGEESRIVVETPPDCFSYDNRLCVVGSPKGGLNILGIVKDKGEAPFENDVFLRVAILSFSGGASVKYKAIQPHQILDENLDNYDLVISYGVPYPAKSSLTDAALGFLRKGKSIIAFSDLSSEGYWKGFGVENGPARTEMATPDVSKIESGYLAFMKGGDINPATVNFFKFAPVAIKEGAEEAGRLYLSGVKDPVIAKIKRDGGSAVLAGFMPTVGYTNIFYNPNFVQFTMRMLADAASREVFLFTIGDQIQRIPFRGGSAEGSFTLVDESGRIQPMEAKKSDTGTVLLSAAPFAGNLFCAVQRNKEPIISLGCNVTRAESDVEPAGEAQFKESAASGLSYDATLNFAKLKAKVEHIVLMAVLLLLALAFDNYAHFWRRP